MTRPMSGVGHHGGQPGREVYPHCNLRQCVYMSARRLGIYRIDLYYLHSGWAKDASFDDQVATGAVFCPWQPVSLTPPGAATDTSGP